MSDRFEHLRSSQAHATEALYALKTHLGDSTHWVTNKIPLVEAYIHDLQKEAGFDPHATVAAESTPADTAPAESGTSTADTSGGELQSTDSAPKRGK